MVHCAGIVGGVNDDRSDHHIVTSSTRLRMVRSRIILNIQSVLKFGRVYAEVSSIVREIYSRKGAKAAKLIRTVTATAAAAVATALEVAGGEDHRAVFGVIVLPSVSWPLS